MGFKEIAIASAIAAVAGGIVVGPSIIEAEAVVANTDFGNIRQVQQLAVAVDGNFAPSLDWLTDNEFGVQVELRKDAESFYAASASGKAFIFASKLSSGGVLVASDSADAVTCDEYTTECVVQVTDDAELINAVPVWVAH